MCSWEKTEKKVVFLLIVLGFVLLSASVWIGLHDFKVGIADEMFLSAKGLKVVFSYLEFEIAKRRVSDSLGIGGLCAFNIAVLVEVETLPV